MGLTNLLEKYAGIIMDRQYVLAGILGEHNWDADIESGMLAFEGADVQTPFEIVGTYSFSSETWMWSWANEASGLPENMTAIARKLHALGEAQDIRELVTPDFSLDPVDLHVFGIMACGIGEADAFYVADYGDGILVAVLTGDRVRSGWQPDHQRALLVFPQVISTFEVDHKSALRNYLQALGYEVKDDKGSVAATRDKQQIQADFDDIGRLTSLKG